MKNKKIYIILFIFVLLITSLVVLRINTNRKVSVENYIDYFIPNSSIHFQVDNSWEIQNNENCNIYPILEFQNCTELKNNGFTLYIDLIPTIEGLGSGALIRNKEYESAKKIIKNDVEITRFSYTYSNEEKVFVQLLFIQERLSDSEYYANASAYHNLNGSYISIAYILPVDYMGVTDVNNIPEIQEMDKIVESINFE